MSQIVAFVCVAKDHATLKPDRSSEHLTVHEGKWAVCPSGRPSGHVWEAQKDGVSYDGLFRRHVAERSAR